MVRAIRGKSVDSVLFPIFPWGPYVQAVQVSPEVTALIAARWRAIGQPYCAEFVMRWAAGSNIIFSARQLRAWAEAEVVACLPLDCGRMWLYGAL